MTNNTDVVNKLLFALVSGRQAEDLMQALVRERFYFTRLDSAGLIFQDPTVCLMIGLNGSRLERLKGLIAKYCPPRKEYIPVQFNPPAGLRSMSMIEAQIGGALVYIVDVDHFEQY